MHAGPSHALSPLELSHVYYDASSRLSQLMAIMTLSPILVVPAYLAVFVFERELVVLSMLAGQLANELLSWLLKHYLKEERPYADMDSGYASPSSHSQFFGFLFTFLALHLAVVQRAPAAWPLLRKRIWFWKRGVALAGLGTWSFVVCFSRWFLNYHTPSQILLGFFVGAAVAVAHCALTEILPRRNPAGLPARARASVLRLLNVGGEWGLEVEDRWAPGLDGWEKFAGRPSRGLQAGSAGAAVGESSAPVRRSPRQAAAKAQGKSE